VSCKIAFILELDKTTLVKPPTVNKNKKPAANNIGVVKFIEPLYIVVSQLNTFIPVGSAIIIVAAVKRVSTSNSTVYT
jgi:hypothetical protein